MVTVEGDVSLHLVYCHCVLIVEGSGHDPGAPGLDLWAAFSFFPLEL